MDRTAEISRDHVTTGGTSPPQPKRIHWKTGPGILLGGAVVQSVLWFWCRENPTYQVFSAWYIWPTVAVLELFWWTVMSGFRRRTKLIGLSTAALAVAAFVSLFRFVEFDGAMRPRFVFRWSGPDEPDDEYWASLAGGTVSPGPLAGQDWPQFRGPQQDGVVRGEAIRLNWDQHPPKELWRHLVGKGWSSFAVAGGAAYTLEQRGNRETTVCYDFDSGLEIWTHSDPVRFDSTMGGDGPRATPTVHEGRVYTLGATGILNCLDAATGRRHWSKDTLREARADVLEWGMAGSPVIEGDLVFVNPGGGRDRGVIAYHRLTGEEVWAAGDDPASYSTPKLATIHGVRQLLVHHAVGLSSYDVQTGRELWSYRDDWRNTPKVNAAQPIVRGNRVFISAGYQTGSALLEIEYDGTRWSIEVPWRKPNFFRLKFNDAVYKDGYVFGLDDSILSCIDFETGRRMWRLRENFGYGQVLLVDDVLLVSAESGEIALVEATPERPRVLARFKAVEGVTWNHPVISHGRLLVRNNREAACFDIGHAR